MVTKVIKTIDDQIAAAEATIKKQKAKIETLKAKKSGSDGLTKESPGMSELFDGIQKVGKENNCNNIEFVKAIVRMKKLPVRIEITPKKPRDTAEKKLSSESTPKIKSKKPTLVSFTE